jgi:hypothetical protein
MALAAHHPAELSACLSPVLASDSIVKLGFEVCGSGEQCGAARPQGLLLPTSAGRAHAPSPLRPRRRRAPSTHLQPMPPPAPPPPHPCSCRAIWQRSPAAGPPSPRLAPPTRCSTCGRCGWRTGCSSGTRCGPRGRRCARARRGSRRLLLPHPQPAAWPGPRPPLRRAGPDADRNGARAQPGGAVVALQEPAGQAAGQGDAAVRL